MIKGSEVVTGWTPLGDGVWTASLPDSFFGDYNPYTDVLYGDWYDDRGRDHHTGEIYLNGVSLYEVADPDAVRRAEFLPRAQDPEASRYAWCCEHAQGITTLYANFHHHDPNRECVEIHVRPACFFPQHTGVDYITVEGFRMCHAATGWAPPTAFQRGMIGPNWSRGWIIRNNILHDSKCVAISLDKEATTDENYGVVRKRKAGFNYQLEAVFRALRIGWNRDTVGSYTVTGNIIHDCEQAGIVGHMGCAFSEIRDNHIYRIHVKRQFCGAEIAGIKFHAALDTRIVHNRIHDCLRGICMDWQNQVARLSRNLVYRTENDLMMEVCHGPCLVDNNLFLSQNGLVLYQQGAAFVHNLIAGSVEVHPVRNRATPYHFPHSTAVMGTELISAGDDRYYQNIFVGPGMNRTGSTRTQDSGEVRETQKVCWGLSPYDDFSPDEKTYRAGVEAYGRQYGAGTVTSFERVPQPVWLGGNVYYNGAQPCRHEQAHSVPGRNPGLAVQEKGDAVYLSFSPDAHLSDCPCSLITTDTLGAPRISEMAFENPDGTPLTLDRDYFDAPRGKCPVAGPFAALKPESAPLKIW